MRIKQLLHNAKFTFQEDGIYAFTDRIKVHLDQVKPFRKKIDPLDTFVDVLFINGCAYSVPHPIRYRVDHQVEQCIAYGLSARKVDEWNLKLDEVRTARTFVIFRCPYNDRVGEFIREAKRLNKTVLYDIDDLVIDRKYTDQIKFLETMSAEERAGYDAGVDAMQKTMLLCDGVITTTEGMAEELKKYLPVVHINRNVASEGMVFQSKKALEERDVLPFMQENEVSSRDKKRWKNAVLRAQHEDRSLVHIGYFSGSITHNEDFQFIIPALEKLMDRCAEVRLHIVGELDVPKELAKYKDRIIAESFLPWRRLPKLIASMDINIAPLVDSVFNRAKSENKWLEASLVKVPTVASNVGAFAHEIEHNVTGLLCDTADDWFNALYDLVRDSVLRKRIGTAAYEVCMNSKTTISGGCGLVDFIKQVSSNNIALAVPSLDISGGNLVTFRHAQILHDAGYDVTLLDGFGENSWFTVGDVRLPVLNRRVLPAQIDDCPLCGRFDKLVATFWETEQFVARYWNAGKKYYFVQNQEQGFYGPLDWHRFQASATYRDDVQHITISQWCENWLRAQYGKYARYARNGIDCDLFKPCPRDYSGKIRILIEGDCSVDYKNVDESFRIANALDPERFEVWYLSYKGKPKPFYRVDKFLHSVPHEEVADIYRQCHILLKTSLLESFSYPPLEMMATGGVSVVLSNPGNAEYLVDRENALLFERGQEERAVSLIEEVASNEELRSHLIENGIATALSRDWSSLTSEILSLYS
ncbi:hypothetical protein B5G20_06630 [Collinsella sp. An7]|uniref:glycosyltransferase n=1 Tax=Collinsella sp. An7 TaxID=1965651 RepID=UPI000B390403|nr:glycosyltransferase [Collinsella sp. An7]OUN46635.1 hypothetical protein B5G20_06630 [Collinsella sp. An7]